MLQAESDFINDNKDIIYEKAQKIYRNVVKVKIEFFKQISCKFELLEEKSKYYLKNHKFNYIKLIEV